jgi:NADPH:quinone reductase-like Zn-dependent oxidoreductase
MSRLASVQGFGNVEHIVLRVVPEPHPGPGEIRVRVRTVGLNAMDWKILSSASTASAFGLALPFGLGFDFAGVVDEVGGNASGYKVGDRVFGSVHSRAASDHLILQTSDVFFRTPSTISDEVAATLTVAGLTASATIEALDLGFSDTVLIGGAAGGVGVLAVQLAQMRGARVLATGADSTASFLRVLGAQPFTYGPGLARQIRSQNERVSAAIDLYGFDSADAALELGVPRSRIVTVNSEAPARRGFRTVGAVDAPPGAVEALAEAVANDIIRIHLAASFPLNQIREAMTLQATHHVHGKVIVVL